MTHGSGLRSATLAAAVLLSLSSAQADTSGNARAVIRGTGTDVTIVYRAPKTAPPDAEPVIPSDVVAEALRLKTSGDDDAAIIAFLRLHQAELPDVIEVAAIRDLRRAGVGDPVIAVLSSFAAVDIGETGEGSPQEPQAFPETTMYGEAYPDLAGMGYPFYSSYGGGYFGGGHRGKRFGRHDFPRGSAFAHFGKPSFPKRHFPISRSPAPRTPHRAPMAHRIR